MANITIPANFKSQFPRKNSKQSLIFPHIPASHAPKSHPCLLTDPRSRGPEICTPTLLGQCEPELSLPIHLEVEKCPLCASGGSWSLHEGWVRSTLTLASYQMKVWMAQMARMRSGSAPWSRKKPVSAREISYKHADFFRFLSYLGLFEVKKTK